MARTSSLLDFFKVQRGGNPAVAQRAGALAHDVRVSLLRQQSKLSETFDKFESDFFF